MNYQKGSILLGVILALKRSLDKASRKEALIDCKCVHSCFSGSRQEVQKSNLHPLHVIGRRIDLRHLAQGILYEIEKKNKKLNFQKGAFKK